MSFEFIVSVNDVVQMRGGLTQATTYLINRYGSLDEGISAGARILPEWLQLPPNPPADATRPGFTQGPSWHLAQQRI